MTTRFVSQTQVTRRTETCGGPLARLAAASLVICAAAIYAHPANDSAAGLSYKHTSNDDLSGAVAAIR